MGFLLRAVSALVAVASIVWAAQLSASLSSLGRTFSRWAVEGATLVSSEPFGWKLEPRLSRATAQFSEHLQRLWGLAIWPALCNRLFFPSLLLCAASCASAVTQQPRYVLLALWATLALTAMPSVALFAYSARGLLLAGNLLSSLGALLRGSHFSVLRNRYEPMQHSMEAVFLALLLFAAVLLLTPVLVLYTALFGVFALPVWAAYKAIEMT